MQHRFAFATIFLPFAPAVAPAHTLAVAPQPSTRKCNTFFFVPTGRLLKFAYTHFSSVAEFPGSQQQQIVSYMSGKFPLFFAPAILKAIYFAFWPRPRQTKGHQECTPNASLKLFPWHRHSFFFSRSFSVRHIARGNFLRCTCNMSHIPSHSSELNRGLHVNCLCRS